MTILITVAVALLLDGLFLVSLHTYWPIGDPARHLSNLDAVLHSAVFFGMPWIATCLVRKWRSRNSKRSPL